MILLVMFVMTMTNIMTFTIVMTIIFMATIRMKPDGHGSRFALLAFPPG